MKAATAPSVLSAGKMQTAIGLRELEQIRARHLISRRVPS